MPGVLAGIFAMLIASTIVVAVVTGDLRGEASMSAQRAYALAICRTARLASNPNKMVFFQESH